MRLADFAGRGVAEPTRLMFAIAKQPYEGTLFNILVLYFISCFLQEAHRNLAIRCNPASSLSSRVRSTDERLSIDFATWARPEFDAKQKAGDFTVNMDSCPVLSVNGVVVGQSKAIARLVAKKLGFFGASDVEAAQIDFIADHGYEMNDAFASHTAGKKDDELEAAKGTFAIGWFTAAI